MSDLKNLRRRLEALNRGSLPKHKTPRPEVEELRRKIRKKQAETSKPPARPILYSRDVPRHEPKRGRARQPRGTPVCLEAAVNGVEVETPHGGKAFLVETRLDECREGRDPLCEAFCKALVTEDSHLRQRLRQNCGADHVRPEDVVFLDLETTGLGSSPLFLIGTMTWESAGLVIRQYLARTYAEERAAISIFVDVASQKRLLITFNGKSYDLPYTRMRAAANSVPFAFDAAHFDLLHECRRAWRDVLPDCKLQTLERHICRRARGTDIPGADIPDAYHAFVRTGNAVQMIEILRHNRLDLITLAELMTRFPALPEPK